MLRGMSPTMTILVSTLIFGGIHWSYGAGSNTLSLLHPTALFYLSRGILLDNGAGADCADASSKRQFGFASPTAAGALAGAGTAASGAAGFGAPPVRRSSTERNASRVLRSLTAASSCAEAGERRVRLSGSGKPKGSSHRPRPTNGRSKPGGAFGTEVRLATPFISYSRAGTEAVPLKVIRAAGPSTRISSAVAMPSLNLTAMFRLS